MIGLKIKSLFHHLRLFRRLGIQLAQRPFACRGAPVVALPAEGHQEQVVQAVVIGLQVSGDADGDLLLGDIEAQSFMEKIPPTENHRKIGVVFVGDRRVVDAVHAGGDKDIIQEFFQAERAGADWSGGTWCTIGK